MKSIVNGLDPLALLGELGKQGHSGISTVLNRATKGTVANILKSYTGFFDVVSEPIQNALDATQRRFQIEGSDKYVPRIWITISLKDKFVRVTDNGIGMNLEQFRYCFTPNVSFKAGDDLRGNKGVGATYLAYGFNYTKLQSRGKNNEHAAVLRTGRQWVEDSTEKIERPTLQAIPFDVAELPNGETGTSIEIRLTGQGGEKPKDLGWHGAFTADRWLSLLRIVSPLGGIYLNTAKFKPEIEIEVIDIAGAVTKARSDSPEFLYPHEIPNLKCADLKQLRKAIAKIQGDHKHIREKTPAKFKNLDCIWDVWSVDDLLADDNGLGLDLSKEDEVLLRQHSVIIYGAHLHTSKTFQQFNKSLGLRQGIEILKGGLQLASDGMPQGEMLVIPLKRYTGYQRNTFIIFHLTNGNPDLGRKVFQPEIKELAERTSVSITNQLIRFRANMKSDTGSVPTLSPNKELHEWKKSQESWRDNHPSGFEALDGHVTYLSLPREEQDVVALYNQLIGSDLIRGVFFYSTTHHDRYDALIEYHYSEKHHQFDEATNQLGIRTDIDLPYQSEPKVLEYKFDFDSMLDDITNESKFYQHVDLVVCWCAGGKYTAQLLLKSLLIEDEGNVREYFGSTHQAFLPGTDRPVFEVCILEELISYLVDPDKEIANQKSKYDGGD